MFACAWLQLPTCDEVEFWKSPEKTGWLYSQGEVIKTWRRRWFVLKEGWLFRFAESDVKPSSKPRGVVDMTLVTNVFDGREATGKPNSVKLTTSSGGQVRSGSRWGRLCSAAQCRIQPPHGVACRLRRGVAAKTAVAVL